MQAGENYVCAVKICGIRRPEDIQIVNRYTPEYIGFVFAESRRQVTAQMARQLKENLLPVIRAAGVFVNAPVETIAWLCREKVIDLVQLHGDEDEAYIKNLKKEVAAPVIKAVRVQSQAQLKRADELPCDMLLLDTFVKNGAYGGTGETFDQRMIPELIHPYFIAGGLNAQNIRWAVDNCRPYGVDVSSGAETEGVKDEEKIKQVIRSVRMAGI